ncbi:MAG: hypothetical protein ACYC63_16890 [Armatimonadota bacterium]
MDFRALGAIATGYFKGRLANMEEKKKAEAQALQEYRQQQQIEFQNTEAARQQTNWQATFEQSRRVNDANIAHAKAQDDYEFGDGPTSKAGQSKAATEAGLADQLTLLSGGETGLAAYPLDQQKVKVSVADAVRRLGQSGPQPPEDLRGAPPNVPYPGENGPEIAPADTTQAALQKVAGKGQSATATQPLQNVAPREDTPWGALTHAQKVSEQARMIAEGRAGREVTYDPLARVTVGQHDPTKLEQVNTQQAQGNLDQFNELRPAVKGSAFVKLAMDQLGLRVAQATEPDLIAKAHDEVSLLAEQIKGAHNSASYTAEQERADIRKLAIMDRELVLKEQQQAFAQTIDRGNLAVSQGQLGVALGNLGVAQFNSQTSRLQYGLDKRQSETPKPVAQMSPSDKFGYGLQVQKGVDEFVRYGTLAYTSGAAAGGQVYLKPTSAQIDSKIADIATAASAGILDAGQQIEMNAALEELRKRIPPTVPVKGGQTPAAAPSPWATK